MKMKYIIIGIIIIILIIVGIFVIKEVNYKEIKDIIKFHYGYNANNMINGYVSYDLECDENCIIKYKPENEPNENTITKEVSNEFIKKLEDLFNEYKVSTWDEFNESDNNVLDGTSFSFSVKTKDNTIISASGYMKYPKNYREVVSKIKEYYMKEIGDLNDKTN